MIAACVRTELMIISGMIEVMMVCVWTEAMTCAGMTGCMMAEA